MCQGRAVADGRIATGRFHDPIAVLLLRPDERVPVEQVRQDLHPSAWRQRLAFESVRACAEVMVPRTVFIDDAIRAAGQRQVVIVGAGLDSRPWRMPELREATVFAVDHPASQADLLDRSAALEPTVGRLEFVPVDLTCDALGPALAAAGHDPSTRTTWVWEGVVPYLSEQAVESTVASFAACSARGSVLVVNYQERSWPARFGRRLSGTVQRILRVDDPLASEPWRSTWTPKAMAALLTRHRFIVDRDRDLLAIAGELGSVATHRRSLANGRVAVAQSAGAVTQSAMAP